MALNVHKDAQTCIYIQGNVNENATTTALHLSNCQTSKNLITYSTGKVISGNS